MELLRDREMFTSEIAQALGMTRASTRTHIARLMDENRVTNRIIPHGRTGENALYRAVEEQ